MAIFRPSHFSSVHSRTAITLVEILVATALGLLITTMTWTAFVRVKATATRASARVNLHQTAAMLSEAFERDFGALAPALALFVRSTPTASATTRNEQIELVFMRSTAPLDKQASQSTYDRYLADHHWVRWLFVRTLTNVNGKWTITSATLKRSTSTPIRHWQTTAALTVAPAVIDPLSGASKPNYNGVNWLNIPRPLRDASAGIASLDNNRYGVPAGSISPNTPIGDIGDLADLQANEQTMSVQVRDFMCGWVDAGGQAVSIDGQTAATYNLNGLYMDVVGPDNGRYLDRQQNVSSGTVLTSGFPQYNYRSDLARRPRLARLAFRLEDKPTQVSQVFTLAVALPGLMPPLTQPAP